MPSRRTIRKPTLWTPEEWHHIEVAALARGVPPLRYVREAALAAKLPPRVRRRGAHELVRQLKRVLINLRQLERAAELEGADQAAAAIRSTIWIAERAVRAAVERRGSAHPLIIAVRDAGRSLNDVAYQANRVEELPPDDELIPALRQIEQVALDCMS